MLTYASRTPYRGEPEDELSPAQVARLGTPIEQQPAFLALRCRVLDRDADYGCAEKSRHLQSLAAWLADLGWTLTSVRIAQDWADQAPSGRAGVKFSRWVAVTAGGAGMTYAARIRQTRYWHAKSGGWRWKVTLESETLADASGAWTLGETPTPRPARVAA
jgi:hypothetical protein